MDAIRPCLPSLFNSANPLNSLLDVTMMNCPADCQLFL